jgi:multidrug efflux pump subunit AcrA (membrane-fusion protein)
LSDEGVYRLTIAGRTFEAAVAGRFPEVDPATRTRTVTLRLDESASKRVVHGEVVRLLLDESVAQPGYWLPLTALAQGSRGLWTTLVAMPDSANEFVVERRDVEVLHTESDRVFVRGTLDAGDLVIDGGTHRIVPGQSVRPVEALAQSSS